MTTTPTRTRSRFAEVALIVFGVYSVSVGLFMMFAPGTFFDTLGNFGVRNDHYIFDNATFEFPLGLMMLAAVKWPAWRVPALAFATLHWGMHALSHIIDPHHGAGDWIGWLEAAGLVATTVLLAIALRTSANADKERTYRCEYSLPARRACREFRCCANLMHVATTSSG